MRVYIYTSDVLLSFLYDEEETINIFGEDHLEDYGTDVPENLVKKYRQTYANLCNLEKELLKFKK